jgi:PAS domain S-box-containing protein
MVTRLVAVFGFGGLVISIALGFIEYSLSMRRIEQTTSQQIAVVSRNLQDAIKRLPPQRRDESIPATLNIFSNDSRVTGALLTIDGGEAYSSGRWPDELPEVAIWNLPRGHEAIDSGLAFDRPTLLNNPFIHEGRVHRLKLLIDGPNLRASIRGQILTQMSVVWTVLGALLLIGLFLLRRWLATPMGRVVGLVAENAPAQRFEEAAHAMRGEFADLAGSIAGMLHRIEQTTQRLDQREYAFEHLYQFAPVAMVAIGPDGRIITANRRAGAMLGFDEDESATGTPFLSFVLQADRPVYRQAIERAETNHFDRREFRLNLYGVVLDVRAEFTVIHNEDGQPDNVRLSLQDVTESKRLIQANAEHRQQLDLIVNHIADAILLVSDNRRVITANNAMGLLLRENPTDLTGRPFDPATTWLPLDFNHPGAFVDRVTKVLREPGHAMRDQFDAADGIYQFQVVPVFDELKRSVAQLWIVKEVSAQARSKRLLEQQTLQIKALGRIGRRVRAAQRPADLMTQAMTELTDVVDAEAVGIALAQPEAQVCWQGGAKTPLATGPPLAEAVQRQLLPRVTQSADTSFWTDLTRLPWASPFANAGLETLAATPLIGQNGVLGVIWIARRGGKPIENHRLHLIEALAPMLASVLDHLRSGNPVHFRDELGSSPKAA